MIPVNDPTNPTDERADENWFREPSPREHRIAAWLFIGFAVNTLLHAWQGWQADWQAAARR